MDTLRIRGGRRLDGEWTVHSAKNALLPIMAASILTDDPTLLEDCPRLSDIRHMGDILQTLGCDVRREERALRIDPQGLCRHDMPDALAKKIRSSIFLLGPILARFGKATATFPGGCEIGLRPIDLHLSGLRQLGVIVREEGGEIRCDGAAMRAGPVHFDYPSVGATENVMMAAVLLPGVTTLHNAAREPEIADLQRALRFMGAQVSGAGTHIIRVQGVRRLRGIVYRAMPDRIVAGTLLAAAAASGGRICLRNAPVEDMCAIFSKLREMGCTVREAAGEVDLAAPERLTAFQQLQTQPHPGFPTDMQVQMLALAARAQGTSVVVENVFENRFTHAGDLNRMGANVMVNGRTAIVKGVGTLYGARVTARDLRGGAALAIAGLSAQGETVVEHAELIDRGYERLETMLSALGADVIRHSEQTQELGGKQP
ncbi:MAG TPA: UDP-N-acetylglucosamine 1-carboxyvinyltransferase [Candidatus Limiplasma stercoravium]|nr:UDP-N-acetylglucosamine 1-carboxyvinyltransferase [Candidatus Limiplasma stercoravium]